MNNNISKLEYNNRTVYDCFNNPFPADCGSPDLNLPSINIDGILHPHKIARYTPDLPPAAISVASEIFLCTLTTPSDSPGLLILTSDDTNRTHATKKY